MDNSEYMNDLSIDPHALEEEWLRQPLLYQKYSELTADAQKNRDKAKEKLDIVKSQIDKDIRDNFEKYGFDKKPTEAAIASAIQTHKEYQEANSQLINLNYEYNVLSSAVRAFDHKKKALESLVSLWLGSYYSGPKEPRNIEPGKRMIDIGRAKIEEKQVSALNPCRRRRGNA